MGCPATPLNRPPIESSCGFFPRSEERQGDYISIILELSCYNIVVDHNDTAAMFKALGDPTRLRIFEFLIGCCCPVAIGEQGEVRTRGGATAGEVCCHVTGGEKITSTVSFHLKELRNSGLITMERRGKNIICGINREAVARLADYLKESERSSSCCS